MKSRRDFMGSILALASAPAIVSASSLMPIRPTKLWMPPGLAGDFTIESWLPFSDVYGPIYDFRVSTIARYAGSFEPPCSTREHIAVQPNRMFINGERVPNPTDSQARAANAVTHAALQRMSQAEHLFNWPKFRGGA